MILFSNYKVHQAQQHVFFLFFSSSKLKKNVFILFRKKLIVLATWISFTRISDYYHYPFDVVCGALTGVGFAHYFSVTKTETSIRENNVTL